MGEQAVIDSERDIVWGPAVTTVSHVWEDAARSERREWIRGGHRVSLIALHPNGRYVFDVYSLALGFGG